MRTTDTPPASDAHAGAVLRDVGGDGDRDAAGRALRDVDDGAAPAISQSTGFGVSPAAARRAAVRVPRPPVKILFLSANTRDHDRLAADEEYRAIEQRIRAARHRDAFRLIAKLAVRRSDLQDALLEHRPHVVHFACHGSSQSEILLTGDGRASDLVPAASLASLFEVVRDGLVLVVFNACFAGGQADAIRACASAAIGMHAQVEDAAAIRFASALYGALADGCSIHDACELGRAALDGPQRALPQLVPRPGLDLRRVRLVRPARWRALVAIATGLAACAGIVAWQWQPTGHHEPPPAIRGMVRFAATSVQPGVFDRSRRPQCTTLVASDDCAEPALKRVTPVRLEAFEMDVLEVSNADLAGWLNATADHWTADGHGRILARPSGLPLVLAAEPCLGGLAVTADGRVIVSPDKARWPAVCVTWHGASEYCRAQHKRLPLTAEWELAAKGADGRPFPWGSDLPRVDGVAFGVRDGASPQPRDVGTSLLDVSPEGVHDLAGNVAEWVDDGGIADHHVVRGGSWGSRDACHLLGSNCQRMQVDRFNKDLGFRCASSVIDRQ